PSVRLRAGERAAAPDGVPAAAVAVVGHLGGAVAGGAPRFGIGQLGLHVVEEGEVAALAQADDLAIDGFALAQRAHGAELDRAVLFATPKYLESFVVVGAIDDHRHVADLPGTPRTFR